MRPLNLNNKEWLMYSDQYMNCDRSQIKSPTDYVCTSVGTTKPTLRISYDPERMSEGAAAMFIWNVMKETKAEFDKNSFDPTTILVLCLAVVIISIIPALVISFLFIIPIVAAILIILSLRKNFILETEYKKEYDEFFWYHSKIIPKANEHFIKFNKIYQKYYVRIKSK